MNIKKHLLVSIIVLFGILLWPKGIAEAKNLYVNNSGSPACSDSTTYANNSASNPWCTIGRAAWGSTSRSSPNNNEAVRAGDTVIVNAGTYSGTGTGSRYDPLYNPVNTGTSNTPIVFQGQGRVVLEQTGEGAVIGALGRDYITWKGFTIYEINALARSDTGPAVFWSTTGSRLEDSEIDGWDNGRLGSNHNGVRLENTWDVVIRNNKIYNVLNFGQYHHNGAGIMTYSARNSIIEHNEIYNCGSGIFIKGADNQNSIIRYNLVYGTGDVPRGKGILFGVSAGNNNRVYQNIVRNVGRGIAFHPMVENGLQGFYWAVNNTVINTGTTDEDGAIQFNSRANSTGNYTVQNNVISHATARPGIGAIYWDDASYIALDNNDYYNVNAWILPGSIYSLLASWQSALGGCPGAGNDCNSATADPLFVGGSGVTAYKLQSGSPARTLGRTIQEIHGSSGQTIPAGAYITGDEIIGLITEPVSPDTTPPSPPTNVQVV